MRYVHLALAVSLALPAIGQSITVIGYNVESGGSTIAKIKERIAAIDGCDIWGISEAQSNWKDDLEAAAEDGEGANFSIVLGTTGGSDRLAIIYDDDRFDLVSSIELHNINYTNSNGGFRVRSPLVARLKETATDLEFYFMVKHLYRSKADKRKEQAEKLNDWAEVQPLPAIAVGDFNDAAAAPLSEAPELLETLLAEAKL